MDVAANHAIASAMLRVSDDLISKASHVSRDRMQSALDLPDQRSVSVRRGRHSTAPPEICPQRDFVDEIQGSDNER